MISFELSVEFRTRFQEAIAAGDGAFIRSVLEGVNPADITALLDAFESDACKYVFEQLPPEVNAGILQTLDKEIRQHFLSFFSTTELASYIDFMDSDDAADILNQLPVSQKNQVIRTLSDEERASNILELLEYDHDVAGGLMAKELIRADYNWTIMQCIEEIRKQAENVEKIFSVYVVDSKDNLKGKVSLKKLILANDKAKVKDIYDHEIVVVDTSASEEEVASIMQKYDLEAIPVINARGRLVGRITIDDVLDVITENAEEERQLMTGITADVEEDDSVWTIAKARLPWLIIGMSGGLIGAQFLGLFKASIIIIPALAFFIPLITASGGNVGIQSSSIVVQSPSQP